MRVGLIGLGGMGLGTPLRLQGAGHDTRRCDIRPEAGAGLSAAGRACVAAPAQPPPGLDALAILVVNAAQAEAVLFDPGGALVQVAEGGGVLCCTTVAPEVARNLAARVTEAGRLFLDAPVSGGAVGAWGGTMTVMASGAPAAFERAGPALDAVAGKVWRLGEQPGIGSTVTMVNQLLAGVHIAVAGKEMALGICSGAGLRVPYDVISSSAGSSWVWQNRVLHVLAGDDALLSAVNIFVKDLGIELDQARALTSPLPMALAAHQLFLAAAAAGHGGWADAFVIRVWEALADILAATEGSAMSPVLPHQLRQSRLGIKSLTELEGRPICNPDPGPWQGCVDVSRE